jgi:hypothetical protein
MQGVELFVRRARLLCVASQAHGQAEVVFAIGTGATLVGVEVEAQTEARSGSALCRSPNMDWCIATKLHPGFCDLG